MPTLFTSLVADVITLTKRPDLVDRTNFAVKAAVLKAHQSDDYIKDFNEASIQFQAPDYYQTLDYKAILPYWRKPRYIRKYDTAPGVFFKYLEPELVIDQYGVDRTDIFYVAGTNIQIRSSTILTYALLGYYNNPIVTPTGFSSWIADDHPLAIIYEAAAIVFKTIGFDEQVAAYREMVKEELMGLKMHAVTGIGM